MASASDATGFRFRPPPARPSGELGWVLARAFGPPEREPPAGDGASAIELAHRLGLAPRIAARTPVELRERELGAAAAGELQRRAVASAASELRLDAALEALDDVAADLELPYLLLKGRALALGGHAAPGSRASADLDVLVAERRLDELAGLLLARGFESAGSSGYEHHAPALRHASGGLIELHRSIPGVRLEGRRFARFDDVERAGGIETRRVSTAHAGLRSARLPTRELLAAHALAHALAQHATAATFQGWQLIADLIDLGLTEGSQGDLVGEMPRGIARDVSRDEAEAALGLAGCVVAGDDPFCLESGDRRRLLAEHFVALALVESYGEALKARMFDRPLSELPRPLARLRLAGATLAAGGGGLAGRAIELLRRWRGARRASDRLAASRRD